MGTAEHPTGFSITEARKEDAPVILELIRGLADYEKLGHEVVATGQDLERSLFGPRAHAEVLIGRDSDGPVAFALFFHNYSTFLGKPGIYLEDLYVRPASRGRGYGRAMLARLARLARERDCGRLEWSVLDWNAPSIEFYRRLGAVPMDGWTVFRLSRKQIDRLAD